MTVTITTFYKFVRLADCAALQTSLRDACLSEGIKGTILLALEGINGTIAGSRSGIDAVLAHLRSDPRLGDLEVKASQAIASPFQRLKVRLKPEIITLGIPVDPLSQGGTYVQAQDWNQVITDPTVLVLDTRNDYEVQVGTFQGARNPNMASFREFPSYAQQALDPQQHPKIAMFCTGGIRCEKASAFLQQQGFEKVYQLQGGILKYLDVVSPDQSLWQGECFVFDHRVALDHGLARGTHELCYGCGHPISPADQCSPQYQAGISCPYCFSSLTPDKRARLEERQRQGHLAAMANLPSGAVAVRNQSCNLTLAPSGN